MVREQACQTLSLEALLPALDIGRTAPECRLHRGPRFTLSEQENQPGAPHVTRTQGSGTHP
jgi:hypothetical protein